MQPPAEMRRRQQRPWIGQERTGQVLNFWSRRHARSLVDGSIEVDADRRSADIGRHRRAQRRHLLTTPVLRKTVLLGFGIEPAL